MDNWNNDAWNRSPWFPDPEAMFYLLASRTLFALVSYRRIVWWMSRAPGGAVLASAVESSTAEAISRRLATLIQRFPALGACVPHAMAAVAMLRRRHVHANVHFGVLRNPPSGRPLEAHVWVTVGDIVVAGESVMSAFVELTPFA
jgi:hypothetical protein